MQRLKLWNLTRFCYLALAGGSQYSKYTVKLCNITFTLNNNRQKKETL